MTFGNAGPAWRALVIAAAALTLAACATREPRPEGAWLEEREAWFDRQDNWRISGRVGLKKGNRGGSLGFTWRAEGDHHWIHLRTLTGGDQWRLSFSPEGAVLEGSEVGRLSGASPDPLIAEAIGWPIPMGSLSWWIRGLVPPQGGDVRYADDGTIAGVVGPDWRLEYQRFSEWQGRLLPTRLEAHSEPYRVRIYIRDWDFGVEGR